MHPHDSYDIHLIRILHALVSEGSVSKAAAKLNHSQPAMSGALKRLRQLTGDPLLVRTQRGMVPTDHALAILQPARRALAEIDKLFSTKAAFSPSKAETFAISVPEYMDPHFLPALGERVFEAGHQVRLDIRPLYSDAQCVAKLDTGELDLVIAPWDDPPPHLHVALLREDRLVLLARRGHPILDEPLTLEAVAAARHVAVPLSYRGQKSIVDSHLARAGWQRDIWASVSGFGLVPGLLERSDLVFVCVARFAQASLARHDLAMTELPFPLPKVRLLSMWHPRRNSSSSHRWLRQHVIDASKHDAR